MSEKPVEAAEGSNSRGVDDKKEEALKQPGISTAFLIVGAAADGLLGACPLPKPKDSTIHKDKRGPKYDYKISPDDVDSGTLTIFIHPMTPRPLDLKRLHEESALLLQTLQTIVDRIVSEGLEIQLFDVRRGRATNGTPSDEEQHPYLRTVFVEEYTVGAPTRARTFYARTNALSYVTLDSVLVNQETRHLTVDFHFVGKRDQVVVEPIVNPGSNVRQKMMDTALKPRIKQFEGHAFYDRLQIHTWWQLPMLRFWVFIAALYLNVTVGLLAGEGVYPNLYSWTYGDLLLIAFFFWLAERVCSYFLMAGVFDRLRVGLRGVFRMLDNDVSRASLLLSASFVPFVQPLGFYFLSRLKALSVEGVNSAAQFAAYGSVAVTCLLCNPALLLISVAVIIDTLSESIWAVLLIMAQWYGAPPWERRQSLREFARHGRMLLMALGVCIWYHHLGNDENNSSARIASYWMDSNIFFDVGVPLIALLLFAACTGVFFVGRVLWRAQARFLRVRLPRWGL